MNELLKYLHNVSEQVPHGPEAKPVFSRVPAEVRNQLNETARDRALHAAGAEVRVRVGKGNGVMKIWVHNPEPQRVEVYLGDAFLWAFNAGPGLHEIPLDGAIRFGWFGAISEDADVSSVRGSLPRHRFDPALMRFCFPYKAEIGLVSVEGDVEPARAGDVPEKTLLTYGSSITQGASALAAQNSYAPRLAWLLGMDFRNLGFGGSAHCEQAIADYIVAQQEHWDICTLEMGINMRQWSVEEFTARMRPFVLQIARACGHKPVFAMDLFRHFGDLPSVKEDKAVHFRRAVEEAATAAGLPSSQYICLAELPSWSGLGADLLHPGDAGMEEMASSLAERISSQVGA